jgi:predicted GTPase
MEKKMNVLLLRSGTSQKCSLLSFLFSIVLEVLAKAIKQEKEIKRRQIESRKANYLFADDLSFKKNLEDCTHTHTHTHTKPGKFAE